MFEYQICDVADEDIFKKQCAVIENRIPNLEKQDLLIDVDESKIQVYIYGKNKIKVVNSIYENALYVSSTEDIKKYFS